jgi:hypothetical protein
MKQPSCWGLLVVWLTLAGSAMGASRMAISDAAGRVRTFVVNLLNKHPDASPQDLRELARALQSEASKLEKQAKEREKQSSPP